MAGLVVLYVATGMLLFPVEFYDFNSAVSFSSDVDVLSELRGLGGVLFILGLYVVRGGISKKIEKASYDLSIAIYLGFALARVFSIAFDGAPNNSIIFVLINEIIIGLLCVYGKRQFSNC